MNGKPENGAGTRRENAAPQHDLGRRTNGGGWRLAKKGGRHVATAALSLGRKRPRRAYAAGHAAPQQYRRSSPPLQAFSSPQIWSPPEFEALLHFGRDMILAAWRQINLYYQWHKTI
jgi:hypothetical protein